MILTLLKNVEFRSFMIANVVFRLCASGLTVLLGYQVYELTRSPFSLGLLGLFEAIPGVTLILLVNMVLMVYKDFNSSILILQGLKMLRMG